ncbi:MAG: sodium-dependent transporter [Lachnospiraceae bacterium]|nr:sodium-dependent transporter [Lachnospiraceae bacterium]
MEKKRSNFSNKLGFIMAAAGSAVGLGNLWRFPYLAAKHGGGIFLLLYLILAVTLGFTLMVSEISLGRKTRLSVIGAYEALDKRFSFLGYLASVVPFIIVPYYCVIGGWVLKYLTVFVSNQASAAASDDHFTQFITQAGSPLVCFLIFAGCTVFIVLWGVSNGIERVSKILMPVLVVLSIVIAVFVLMQPGAMEGVTYYLRPDFSRFSATTLLAAMGQLFYSMSLSMGIMITYGSYMKSEDNMEQSVRHIELFDTGIAFLAGLMIVPSVFIFSGGDESALGKGPSLMFVTLPKVFDAMAFGTVIGVVFFLLVLFAALTSSISLTEACVSIVQDKTKCSRRTGCLSVAAIMALLGIPTCLGFGVLDFISPFHMSLLDFFDFVSNSILMPVIALLTCIFIGYVIKPKAIIEEVELNGKFKMKTFYTIMIRWIAPVCLVAILIFSVMETLGYIKV